MIDFNDKRYADAKRMGEDAARNIAGTWDDVEPLLRSIWHSPAGLHWEYARAAVFVGWCEARQGRITPR